jgi:hypothetical protein
MVILMSAQPKEELKKTTDDGRQPGQKNGV